MANQENALRRIVGLIWGTGERASCESGQADETPILVILHCSKHIETKEELRNGGRLDIDLLLNTAEDGG